jgi:diacylglycerol kinase family enzyme
MASVVLYINNASGTVTDKSIEALRSAAQRLSQPGCEIEWIEREGGPSLESVIEQKPQRLLIAGGDGTLLYAVAAMQEAGIRIPLGIVPMGTVNQLARDLDLPLDPVKGLEAALEGTPHGIDLAFVGETPFLCSSVIGFPARFSNLREHYRGRLASLKAFSFARNLAKSFFRDRPFVVQIEADGRTHSVQTRLLIISHNEMDESAGLYPSRSSLHKGWLHLYTLDTRNWWSYAGWMLKHTTGGWKAYPHILNLKAQEIHLKIGTLPAQVRLFHDGEVADCPQELSYTIKPKNFEVLVPKGSNDSKTAD